MEDLYLTKEEAIAHHRKMWNWIADRLEEHHLGCDIHMYKAEYIKNNFPDDTIQNYCFCCQYAAQEVDDIFEDNFCIYCPLRWGTEANTDAFFCEQGNCDISVEVFDSDEKYGLWSYAQRLTENYCYEEAAKVARQIANLPKK